MFSNKVKYIDKKINIGKIEKIIAFKLFNEKYLIDISETISVATPPKKIRSLKRKKLI